MQVIILRRMAVAVLGERRGAYRVLIGKPEGERPNGRRRCH